jgi:hypothetical protein
MPLFYPIENSPRSCTVLHLLSLAHDVSRKIVVHVSGIEMNYMKKIPFLLNICIIC